MHIYKNNLTSFARENRNAGNLAEALLWNELKQRKLGFRFTKQKPIGKYIVDFYCPKLAFIIELDGNSHDNKYEYDSVRDKYLQSLGLFVMRIDNEDILFHKDKAFFAIETYMLYKINEIEQSKH